MVDLSLQLMFFSKHSKKEAERFCKKLARRKGVKAKLLSIEPDLEADHVFCYVWVPPWHVQDAKKVLPKIGERLKKISGIDDVIVQVMGHPDIVHRTKSPPVAIAA